VTFYKSKEALKQYRNLGLASEIGQASPHRLIQLLFEGAVTQLLCANGAMERRAFEEKARFIDKAVAIISGLRSSLDLSQGELPENLDRLYEYMSFRLLEASQDNDATKVGEVIDLLKTLKSGWDEIPNLVLSPE
jgi:flagellar protein FliS